MSSEQNQAILAICLEAAYQMWVGRRFPDRTKDETAVACYVFGVGWMYCAKANRPRSS